MRKRLRSPMSAAAVAVAAALTLAACGSSSSPSSSASGGSGGGGGNKSVVVASFNFGESQLLAAMYVAVLKKAGFDASTKSLGAREIVEPALEKGSSNGGVDVVPEYLSTFTEFLNTKANGKNAPAMASPDVQATLANAKKLAANVNIDVLTPSAATDQNAFAVTKNFATKNNLTKLSDLASYHGPLVLGGPPECPTRPFCKPGLEKTYGIHFTGFSAWIAWLIVHIYFLTGFANRFLVVYRWAWAYLTSRRGARLILGKDWRTHKTRRGEEGSRGRGPYIYRRT